MSRSGVRGSSVSCDRRKTQPHTRPAPTSQLILRAPYARPVRIPPRGCLMLVPAPQTLTVTRVTRAYKTELDLHNRQVTACRRHAGAARSAYNWGVRRKQEAYAATGTSPSAIDLHRELNALKQTELPWMYAVSKCAPQEAL